MSGSRRLDIQGLRAVAVLLAMAFHAGLPLPGGFVGVDVFFVISGFVITGMIQRERSATKGFRFRSFYLRRCKRLAPALALVIAVTMVLTTCLLSPFNTQQIAAKTGVGAMLLVANLVIAVNTGNYFAAPAESNPLLHTWSLSVEEQFYLVFPALLCVGWMISARLNRRIPWPALLICAASLASFGLTQSGSPGAWHADAMKFFGPLPRAWEFGAGALLALATVRWRLPQLRAAQALSWLGAGMLVASALLIDETVPFPGSWTLLPVGATVLLIAAGTSHSTAVSRALSTPFMVTLGDWSYSLYLWHWPLKVFAVQLWPGSRVVAVTAVALSVIPAAACYRWIEQPFRTLPQMTRLRTTALIAVVTLPSLLVASLTLVTANHYWLPRYKSGAMGVAHRGDVDWTDYFLNLKKTYYPCTDVQIREHALRWQGITRCRQSKPDSRIDVVLIGDSHAEHLFVGLAEAAPSKNIAYYVVAETPVRSDEDTNRIIDHVAADPAIATVVVSVNWASRGVPHDGLIATFNAFTATGKTVYTTDDVPTFPFDAVSCGYRIAPILPAARCSMDRKRFEAELDNYYQNLLDVAHSVPSVRLLDTARYFCDASLCRMNNGQDLLYRDKDHLNNVGSRFLARQLLADYADLRSELTAPPNVWRNEH
ncbi:acyltransferase family protein [Mycobacterium paragordonae]|nr:acyltransferase family protein [Mycobacterium paragordonae]